mmetsp:Transcript_28972/g.43733  ORF Transcript_28972/g.43733 Transcript_28972/m.43733 type:complete len:104 (-) Transcript_28972:2341-2652(-)
MLYVSYQNELNLINQPKPKTAQGARKRPARGASLNHVFHKGGPVRSSQYLPSQHSMNDILAQLGMLDKGKNSNLPVRKNRSSKQSFASDPRHENAFQRTKSAV